MIRLFLTALVLCAVSSCGMSPAFAGPRHRAIIAHESCNETYPNAPRCEGVSPSPRGERIARSGFGSAQKIYTPRVSAKRRSDGSQLAVTVSRQRVASVSPSIVAHPSGCPSRAFCGCGAAVRVFGSPVRSLWLAANWFKFPRTSPAPGTVAVRRHHVFVLEADLGGGVWRVYDANSGGHATRVHARSIAGYVIVNPHGAG